MPRIHLIHWNAAEAEERSKIVSSDGYDVVYEIPRSANFFHELEANPPDAIVIDLSRLPSQGRDLALTIRQRKSTRAIPLVFAEGAPEKVERVKELLPDAFYTTWSGIRGTLKKALAHPPIDPIVPQSVFDGYAGKVSRLNWVSSQNQSRSCSTRPRNLIRRWVNCQKARLCGNVLRANVI